MVGGSESMLKLYPLKIGFCRSLKYDFINSGMILGRCGCKDQCGPSSLSLDG